jgi:hypothetical protein
MYDCTCGDAADEHEEGQFGLGPCLVADCPCTDYQPSGWTPWRTVWVVPPETDPETS